MLVEHIYKKKIEEFKERISEFTDPRVIYVTDLVQCPLKREFRVKYPELSFKFEPALILGELVHVGLQTIFKDKYKAEVSIEHKIQIDGTQYIIKGRVDLLDKDTIIEIKTTKSDTIPYEHHIKQLQIYLNLLKKDKGILLYVTPTRITEFKIHREELDIKELVKEYLSRKKPYYEWECKYCPYANLCPYKR